MGKIRNSGLMLECRKIFVVFIKALENKMVAGFQTQFQPQNSLVVPPSPSQNLGLKVKGLDQSRTLHIQLKISPYV